MGVFADWQPRYAEAGIATFPVRDKRPAVAHYLKAGCRASRTFAERFGAEDAFGLACKRNRIAVVDIDSPDERLLADALDEFGPTPFVVRSGSGNHQAWYRHNGEGRRIRPDRSRPIDILGDGYVVAPPSRGTKGDYRLLTGTLDDLANLPPMRSIVAANDDNAAAVEAGRRNNTLWRHCMSLARDCPTVEALALAAMEFNRGALTPPLPDGEVADVVAKVWAKETAGQNWFGRGARVIFDSAEIDDLLSRYPDAFMLLTILRRHHWGRTFIIANAMCAAMPGGGWGRPRFASARKHLLDLGFIEEVRAASRFAGPAEYQFKGVTK